MYSKKIVAGSRFPVLNTILENLSQEELGKPGGSFDWKMIVAYRGKHCPLCTKYLNELQEFKQRLEKIGIDLIAVSADSKEQLEDHKKQLIVNFKLAYGLTIEQMQQLGLYLSYPRSEQETDHVFSEPGLFIVNNEGNIQVVDISNNPFVRPELESLVRGLEWIREPSNQYPARGTYYYEGD
ncbi:redoxin domain-containing protein [Spartinivicinus ruber]|uniref:redoxin domain-containing protein n=1 Tax=Spartinivicinus ruber TaxID=2683272 RepID=UPI0013D57FB8|nr:redoxin domain-containing protein [Spartinivicinus ruber]